MERIPTYYIEETELKHLTKKEIEQIKYDIECYQKLVLRNVETAKELFINKHTKHLYSKTWK